jgi:hypothetical protein
MDEKLYKAAVNIDWTQVALNGGAAPCFYLQEDGTFCGRAHRWIGHHFDTNGHKPLHFFVPLHNMLRSAVSADGKEG